MAGDDTYAHCPSNASFFNKNRGWFDNQFEEIRRRVLEYNNAHRDDPLNMNDLSYASIFSGGKVYKKQKPKTKNQKLKIKNQKTKKQKTKNQKTKKQKNQKTNKKSRKYIF
jgi:hypothetical protein